MKIVFMGTATFSEAVLNKLLENNYPVSLVVTQPDSFVGRKKQLKMPEVKTVALNNGIEVYQPVKIKKEYQRIVDEHPDLIITAAYGQIIPKKILDCARLGCINVHASLLPKYRGGAPVHKAIIDDQKETGVTIMYMVQKMDAGNIIAQKATLITDQDTVSTLYERLSTIGAELLIETLPSVLEGTNNSIPQNEEEVTFAKIISHEDEYLTFNQSARMVDCYVRGLNSWPVAYSTYNSDYEKINIKIWAGHIEEYQGNELPGTIVMMTKKKMLVKCIDGAYAIDELQVPGKKKMRINDYLNGKPLFSIGGRFDSCIGE